MCLLLMDLRVSPLSHKVGRKGSWKAGQEGCCPCATRQSVPGTLLRISHATEHRVLGPRSQKALSPLQQVSMTSCCRKEVSLLRRPLPFLCCRELEAVWLPPRSLLPSPPSLGLPDSPTPFAGHSLLQASAGPRLGPAPPHLELLSPAG